MHRCVAVLIVSLALAFAPLRAQSAVALPDPAHRFAVIDSLVDAVPAGAERSVASLASYLASAAPDDSTRARAIFRWLTRHVDYDVEGFRTKRYGDVTPAGVLQRRAAVCEGYARLAEALGRSMGMQVEVVTGWSKGYGYSPGDKFDGPTNHAWNAIRVNGQWGLMDATWGAGFVTTDLKFVRRFQGHYFLTAPDAFLFDHLPELPRWQLRERPASATEYGEMVYLRPGFFSTGLQVGSHPRARVEIADRATLTFGTPRPVRLLATLSDASGAQPLPLGHTAVTIEDGLATVHVAPPRPGTYVLRLFASSDVTSDVSRSTFDWAADYRVIASKGNGAWPLPDFLADAQTHRVRLLEPWTGTLAAGKSHRIRLVAPGALAVAASIEGRLVPFTADGDAFTLEAVVPTGPVTIFARFDEGANYVGLLRFQAK